VTCWAPAASGAGVTLVMAYLNGNHIPHLLRWQTLATKIVGATAGVASGLAIGPEGPMVHIGACIASNVCYATDPATLRALWPWRSGSRHGQLVSRRSVGSAAVPGGGAAAATAAATAGTPGQAGTEGSAKGALWEDLHDDSAHREFVSAGASAGLSVRRRGRHCRSRRHARVGAAHHRVSPSRCTSLLAAHQL
jgi:Voltage gated chloride channel